MYVGTFILFFSTDQLIEMKFYFLVVEEIFDTFERDEELNDALMHNRPLEDPTDNEITNSGRRKTNSTLNQILELENKKMKFCQEQLEDPDRQFLLSLAPELKRLSARNKALAKVEIQQVLLKYMDTG